MAPEMMTNTNNPNVTNWNMETGYENRFDTISYPIRVFNAKPPFGLIAFMRLFERDLDYLCQGGIQGKDVKEPVPLVP